jgi:ribosomal protein S12 methylthiotransferase accessory factor
MTGKNSPAFNTKDVPQFAPNFTVYLLPPDAVCLYSEHRKFFLHGELYCALAPQSGRRLDLSANSFAPGAAIFPRTRSSEALTRLLDRGYLLPASRASAGAVAAYWASLGLSPQAVHKVSRPAASAFKRSTCREQRSLPPR